MKLHSLSHHKRYLWPSNRDVLVHACIYTMTLFFTTNLIDCGIVCTGSSTREQRGQTTTVTYRWVKRPRLFIPWTVFYFHSLYHIDDKYNTMLLFLLLLIHRYMWWHISLLQLNLRRFWIFWSPDTIYMVCMHAWYEMAGFRDRQTDRQTYYLTKRLVMIDTTTTFWHWRVSTNQPTMVGQLNPHMRISGLDGPAIDDIRLVKIIHENTSSSWLIDWLTTTCWFIIT